MHTGRLIFSQLMNHLPMHVFHACVARHQGNRYVKRFPCSSGFARRRYGVTGVSTPAARAAVASARSNVASGSRMRDASSR